VARKHIGKVRVCKMDTLSQEDQEYLDGMKIIVDHNAIAVM
jgi:hypothetical protein